MEKIKSKNLFMWTIIKGSLYALCVSLVLVLIFAFLLRFIAVADTFITTVAQIIKGLSIVIGVCLGMKNFKEMGFITGFLVGLLYTLFAFLFFSILDGFTFEFSKTLLNDCIFGSVIGGIVGIIVVNMRK